MTETPTRTGGRPEIPASMFACHHVGSGVDVGSGCTHPEPKGSGVREPPTNIHDPDRSRFSEPLTNVVLLIPVLEVSTSFHFCNFMDLRPPADIDMEKIYSAGDLLPTLVCSVPGFLVSSFRTSLRESVN